MQVCRCPGYIRMVVQFELTPSCFSFEAPKAIPKMLPVTSEFTGLLVHFGAPVKSTNLPVGGQVGTN
jgi:hypothetical protein